MEKNLNEFNNKLKELNDELEYKDKISRNLMLILIANLITQIIFIYLK